MYGRGWGEEVRLSSGPQGIPPEARPVGCLGSSGAAAEKQPLPPTRSRPPYSARSRLCLPGLHPARAAPAPPPAAEGPAGLPAPPPVAPSPRLPSARGRRGAPTLPHPRRPSVERREAGAQGELGSSRWKGGADQGPAGGGEGLGTRLFVSPSPCAGSQGRSSSRQVPTSLRDGAGGWRGGPGRVLPSPSSGTCGSPLSRRWWSGSLRGRGVGGWISGPEREQGVG